MDVVLIALAGVGLLIGLAGGVMMVVAAFRVHVLWGLAVLLVPFAGLVFVVACWKKAKGGFLVQVAGGALLAAAVASGISMGMGNRLAPLLAEGRAQLERARSGGRPLWRGQGSEAPPATPDTPPPEPDYPPVPEGVFIGLTLAEARELLGEPPIMSKAEGVIRYTYPQRHVELVSEDGQVVSRQIPLVPPEAEAAEAPPQSP
ncbi:MAG: hypothetical protein BWZ02_01930 [Lentisphaerae bacterium ADurb.BinA184]|nr:MAG: hypothetical protein BWZ02_01930 [Lentisphaerae bacterium ADurb.BinA184]